MNGSWHQKKTARSEGVVEGRKHLFDRDEGAAKNRK